MQLCSVSWEQGQSELSGWEEIQQQEAQGRRETNGMKQEVGRPPAQFEMLLFICTLGEELLESVDPSQMI